MISGTTIDLVPFDRCFLERTRIWTNDLTNCELLGRSRPVTEIEHEQWYQQTVSRRDCVMFAIRRKSDEQHVGNIWLWDIDSRNQRAEVRILVGDTSGQGKGAGTESIVLLSKFARRQLNLRRVYAHVFSTNPRARRAFEKAGFKLEGTLRRDRWVGNDFADVFVLGKVDQELD